MNENVTIKTPKRRRWIARLLISALCILLASSLLFVSVVAENVNSFSYVDSEYESTSVMGFYFDDADNVSCCVASLVSESLIRVDLFYIDNSVPFLSLNFQLENVLSLWAVSSNPNWIAISYLSSDGFIYVSVFDYSSSLLKTDFITGIIPSDKLAWFVYYNNNSIVCFCAGKETEADSISYFLYEPNGLHSYSVSMVLIYGDSSWNVVPCADTPAFKLSDLSFYSVNSSANSVPYVKRVIAGKSAYGSVLTSGGLRPLSISGGVVSVGDSLGNYFGVRAFRNFIVSSDFLSSNSFNSSFIGLRSTTDAISFVYATSSEYVPPESSDETTTEPPPESSEESSIGGVIDLYSYDKLSDGSYQSAQIGTLDLTDATGLRVFLGMYLLGDNVWSDIKTPLTLLVYRDDGSLDTYTYDYYAAGFAWGDGSPGSFTFPKFIGGFFDIPLSSSSELYFASSAPGGTIWVQNNSVVLRQINLLNSDSYVELDNVSAEECVISVYDSPSDDDPESFVYTSGVLKYTLRKRSFSSSIPVSLEYGETGIVHGVMKYNGADFTVSSIILASDPDLMPPIYDFESMDNALSEAYDDVSRQQYLENLLTSYIENAYGTVSYDPDTSGAFLGGVDLMGDIVDSSGGSTIISAFVDMWSIHPFFPAMVGLLGTFLIFSFFLRKA